MNILYLNGEIFDTSQIISTNIENSCVRITFKNGDEISLRWRDEAERGDILKTLAAGPAA